MKYESVNDRVLLFRCETVSAMVRIERIEDNLHISVGGVRDKTGKARIEGISIPIMDVVSLLPIGGINDRQT